MYARQPDAALRAHVSLLLLPQPNPTQPARCPQNAIVALGLVGAGTNNARLAGILRNLASYYYKDPVLLFLVKVGMWRCKCANV